MVKVKDFEVQDTCEYLLYLGYIRLQMCFDANETLHGTCLQENHQTLLWLEM